jgi:hypothetical protein
MSIRDKLVDLAWKRWVMQEQAAAGEKPEKKSAPGR